MYSLGVAAYTFAFCVSGSCRRRPVHRYHNCYNAYASDPAAYTEHTAQYAGNTADNTTYPTVHTGYTTHHTKYSTHYREHTALNGEYTTQYNTYGFAIHLYPYLWCMEHIGNCPQQKLHKVLPY